MLAAREERRKNIQREVFGKLRFRVAVDVFVYTHLEFGDHASLGVVAGAVLVDQTFGQHLSVKLLENIFVLDVLEHNHLKRGKTKTYKKV